MLDVDESCSWVFAVDVRGESYVVTSKKVKLSCLVSNFISSIPHIPNTKKTIKILKERLSKLLLLN